MSDHDAVIERETSDSRSAVTLSASHRDAIFDQARREYPNECCGVLLGRGDTVERIQPTTNTLHSPVVFQVDPREILDVLLAAEAESLEVIGYYHSHPGSTAYPSPTDVRYAAGWPGAVHVIASLAESSPAIRAYSIETSPATPPASAGGEGDSDTQTDRPAAEIRELEVRVR